MRSLSNSALVQEAARKALSAQEMEKASQRFRQLCRTPGENVGELEEVAEILRNAGFKNELMQMLRDALTAPDANPHVGALWIRRVVSSRIWDHRYPDGLDLLCKNGEIGHRAIIEFLDLAGSKRRSRLVQLAVARHGRWLKEHPRGWSAAGRALAQARCYSQAARWMAEWRKHPEIDLPTLHFLAVSMRATRRFKEADEVIRLAMAMPGAIDSFPMLTLWSAQDQAFAGDVQKASATFKQIDISGWEDDFLALYYLVRGVIRVQKAEPASRREAFAVAMDRVHGFFRKMPIYKRDVFLRHEYRRCIARMAKDCGQWSEVFRATWRSAESQLFLVPLLILPGLQLFAPVYIYRLCSRRRGLTK